MEEEEEGLRKNRNQMEKYFGNAYRGDPGVPHADPDRFVNIWVGSAAFSVMAWFHPYMWTLSNQYKYAFHFHSVFASVFSCSITINLIYPLNFP